MTKDLKFLIKIVKQASKIIKSKIHIMPKGDKGDLVTNCDIEIEKFLIAKIKKSYPTFDIVSEEENYNKVPTENCFIIDPIDGTINFAKGLPLWGIQVACIRDGKTCAAVIYEKALKELFSADETGAYLNGKQIYVNANDNNMLYSVEKNVSINSEDIPHRREFYCCAISYPWVACGRLGVAVFPNIKPWDYVAGLYLVEQAGGYTYKDEFCNIAANSKENLEKFKELALSDKKINRKLKTNVHHVQDK